MVAVVAVGLCWWLWPRVDQRFVGKWTDRDGTIWHFHADGTFTLADESFEGGRIDHESWWVRGNKIVIHAPSNNAFVNGRNWLMYLFRQFKSQPAYSIPFEEYPITKFNGDEMQLGYGLDLKRVPESAVTQ